MHLGKLPLDKAMEMCVGRVNDNHIIEFHQVLPFLQRDG